MLLGGAKAAPPVAGPEGRILCGDVILPSQYGATGLGEIEPAAEWTGGGWRLVGLPPAAPDGSDTTLDEAVGYDAQGEAIAVRADWPPRPSGTAAALPGRAEAFAIRDAVRARCTPRADEIHEAHDADVGGGPRRAVDGRAGALVACARSRPTADAPGPLPTCSDGARAGRGSGRGGRR